MTKTVTVIGGGLSWFRPLGNLPGGAMPSACEMRPSRPTPAHTSDRLAELVCSNSMGSTLPDRSWASSSKRCSTWAPHHSHRLPPCAAPGSALAVSRDDFAAEITAAVSGHPNITVVRRGRRHSRRPRHHRRPLTSDQLTIRIQALTGQQHLYFYDAMAPIVAADSIDMSIAFDRAV